MFGKKECFSKMKSGAVALPYWEKLKAVGSAVLQLSCTCFHLDTDDFQHEGGELVYGEEMQIF